MLRKATTRHFVDPCLAVAALNTSPDKLRKDLNFFGHLFESLVVRDLRVYMQELGGHTFHYRDSEDLEFDVILETLDSRWASIEVKLGVNDLDAAAKTLLKFANKIETTLSGEPAGFRRGFGDGYQRRA